MVRWTFTEKRNLTLLAFSTRMFFMGVEYAVIFPSVWLYLKTFHVDYWYLGLVLSAYNMVGIVSTALVGRLVDITRKVRFTGFLWNLAEIVGNFVYALPFYVGLPLIGRMTAGFGEGFISAMWGELARVTTTEQRTRYFAILKGSNLLGAALGPAFNLFLKEIDFTIGKWRIDFRTSPGFIMALIWIAVTIMMLLCVFDLSWELKENPDYQLLIEDPPTTLKYPHRTKDTPGKRASTSPKGRKKSIEPLENVVPTYSQPFLLQPAEKPKQTILALATEAKSRKSEQDDSLEKSKPPEVEVEETKSLPEERETFVSDPYEAQIPKKQHNPFDVFDADSGSDTEDDQADGVEVGKEEEEEGEVATFKTAILDMFTKYQVVVLVYLLFFMYIIHTCLQGISPLIAERMLFWDETKVSILYTAWGMEIILVLVVVWLIAPKTSDRVILVVAVVCGCFSSLSFIILGHSNPGTDLCLYSFLITVFLAGIGISVTVVIGRSLVSKHTMPANQGLVHAILTSFNRLAGLSGPIFGSSLYTRKTLMGWLLATVQVLGLVLLIFAYKKLKVVKKAETVET